jgi:hypothetical protein
LYDACPHAPLVRAQLHGEGQASYKPKLMPPVAQSGFERQLIKWFGHLMRRFRQRDGF